MPEENKIEKRIDGLKASNEKIASSRKIVLDSIGESDKPVVENTERKYALDGLARKSATRIEAENQKDIVSKERKKDSDLITKKDSGFKYIDSVNFLHPADEEIDLKSEIKDVQAEIKKRIDSNQINPALIDDINKKGISFDNLAALAMASRRKSDQKVLPESPIVKSEDKKILKSGDKPRQKLEKKSVVKKEDLEKIRAEKIRRLENEKAAKEKVRKEKEEIKKKERAAQEKAKEVKARKTAERKIRIKKARERIKNIFKQAKNDLIDFGKKFKKDFVKTGKKVLLAIGVMLALIIIVYFVFVLFIVKTGFDKPFTRSLSRQLPIPAFIAKGKVIDYYFWVDVKKQTKPEEGVSVEAEARKDLARYLVMNDLARRYSLPEIAFSEIKKDKPMKDLSAKAVYDEALNQVAINRIRSIKNMIDANNDFVRVSEKYGDELGKTTLTPENKENYTYSEQLTKLAVGEISDIIATENGYYIFRCFEKNADEQILSFVLVKNKDFAQYVEEMINGYEFISFVD